MRRKTKKSAALALVVLMLVNAVGGSLTGMSVKAAEDTAVSQSLKEGLIGYYPLDSSLENLASESGGKAQLHGGSGDTWVGGATGTEKYVGGYKQLRL